jgi:beta-phosphoglucomutase-like phosphatase (HAD superfamily)
LVDTLAACYLAFRRALARAGAPPLTDGEIHALFGPSEEGMLQRRACHGDHVGPSLRTRRRVRRDRARVAAGRRQGGRVRRLLERWDFRPDEAIYVGDAASDVLAAREAGVMAAGAAWAHGARVAELRAARADVIFTDAAAFLAWLDARTQRSERADGRQLRGDQPRIEAAPGEELGV